MALTKEELEQLRNAFAAPKLKANDDPRREEIIDRGRKRRKAMRKAKRMESAEYEHKMRVYHDRLMQAAWENMKANERRPDPNLPQDYFSFSLRGWR